MLKQQAPSGFSISFNRHGKRWGWKQTIKPDRPHRMTEEWGFDTRSAAMAALRVEIDSRRSGVSA